MMWQAFAMLNEVAPDGETLWHSMSAPHVTKEAAEEFAVAYLRSLLRYDHGGAVMVCTIGLVAVDASHACPATLGELPPGSEMKSVEVIRICTKL